MNVGWRKAKLDDVCVVEYGTRVVQKRDGGTVFPVFGGGGETFALDTFNREDRVVIARFGMSERCTRFVSGKFFLNDSGLTLAPKEPNKLIQAFLNHWAFSVNDEIYALGKGTAQKNLDLPVFRCLEVPIPPVPEQERIVRILDEAFEGIATATANAEKNLQNAREVFDSALGAAFESSLGHVRMADLATEITDGDHMPPPKAAQGVPFITISNIDRRTRTIDFRQTFSVPHEYFQKLKPNKRPKRGDVLYTVTGATLGTPVLIKEDQDFCFQRHIGLIRPRPGVDSAWLTYALLSPQVFRQATEGSTGAAQKTVSLAVLRNLSVPLIHIIDQQSTASRLDSLFIETQRLESIYQQKLTTLVNLKQSLLHRAFNGDM